MFPEWAAVQRPDQPRLGGQKAREKIPKTLFADETNTSAVFLVMRDETECGGVPTYFRLGLIAHWKQTGREFELAQGVEKITLILVGIGAFEQ